MQFETIITQEPEIYCEGNDPSMGHPRVYLPLLPLKKATCPYCSRQFVYEKNTDTL